jgi:hypothetical protein
MTKELPDLGHLGDISDWLLEQVSHNEKQLSRRAFIMYLVLGK